jgi:DNA invertase Pin-like site-specific DNA recombinase
MRQVALYTRVSTDRQTTENQERELRAIAARAGWHVVQVYRDEGISGAKGKAVGNYVHHSRGQYRKSNPGEAATPRDVII